MTEQAPNVTPSDDGANNDEPTLFPITPPESAATDPAPAPDQPAPKQTPAKKAPATKAPEKKAPPKSAPPVTEAPAAATPAVSEASPATPAPAPAHPPVDVVAESDAARATFAQLRSGTPTEPPTTNLTPAYAGLAAVVAALIFVVLRRVLR